MTQYEKKVETIDALKFDGGAESAAAISALVRNSQHTGDMSVEWISAHSRYAFDEMSGEFAETIIEERLRLYDTEGYDGTVAVGDWVGVNHNGVSLLTDEVFSGTYEEVT